MNLLKKPQRVMRKVSSTIWASLKWRRRRGKEGVADPARSFPGGDRIFDDELVPIIELRVVMVIEDAVDTGRRDSFDDQERLMMRHAIVAGIELGDGHDREFESAPRQRRGFAQLDQQ